MRYVLARIHHRFASEIGQIAVRTVDSRCERQPRAYRRAAVRALGRGCGLLALLAVLVPVAWSQGAERMQSDTSPKTVIGQRNPPLHDGAQALLAGRIEEGVRLTHEGLERAISWREEEAALSNLCAGYVMQQQFDVAIKYCNLVLHRNENNWRAYNNRAVIYIKTKQYDRAEQDLLRGEELKPGAHTLKVARAMYMDAVHPVSPEVIVDDSEGTKNEDEER